MSETMVKSTSLNKQKKTDVKLVIILNILTEKFTTMEFMKKMIDKPDDINYNANIILQNFIIKGC